MTCLLLSRTVTVIVSFLGRVQNTEGGTLTIKFLERIVGRNDVFG